jgi:hypothetical protein
MTTTVSSLPGLPNTNTDMRKVSDVVNRLVREFNRPDLFTPSYAVDTGSGTAYAITPSSDIRFLSVGQIFIFTAAHANTSSNPTLNVQGLGAGTITKIGGTALVPGDIPANGDVAVIVTSTTPTFQLLSPTAFAATSGQTFLGSDVTGLQTAVLQGPNSGAIGANGQTFNIEVCASLVDSAGGAAFDVGIHDGTNYLSATRVSTTTAGQRTSATFSLLVSLSAAATFSLRAVDVSSASGTLCTTSANALVSNKATYIKWTRLA